MNWARQEAELVMFKAVDDLLRKTGLHPRQIDVLGEQLWVWGGCRGDFGCPGGVGEAVILPAHDVQVVNAKAWGSW